VRVTRSVAMVAVVVAVVGAGVVARAPCASGTPPKPCARPTSSGQGGVLVGCDGDGDDVGARAWLVGQKLNVNTASAAELARVSGVGPSLAGRIVSYREVHGPFTSLNDLDRVDGVGPQTLTRLAELVDAR